MADYSNDVKSQKKTEQRNKTAEFQLAQYTDRLGMERRRQSRDFDRERRLFEKRFFTLRSALQNARRYSQHVQEQRDLSRGDIRRSGPGHVQQTRSAKSALPIRTKPETDVDHSEKKRPASAQPATPADDKVFITQQAAAARGQLVPLLELPVEEGADGADGAEGAEGTAVALPTDDVDTWSNAGRDLRVIAGPAVIERVERNKQVGPRVFHPQAPGRRTRVTGGATARARRSPSQRRQYDQPPSFCYEEFNLKRPNSTIIPKDVDFIKHALAGTKTPLLPMHETLGIGRPKLPRTGSTDTNITSKNSQDAGKTCVGTSLLTLELHLLDVTSPRRRRSRRISLAPSDTNNLLALSGRSNIATSPVF